MRGETQRGGQCLCGALRPWSFCRTDQKNVLQASRVETNRLAEEPREGDATQSKQALEALAAVDRLLGPSMGASPAERVGAEGVGVGTEKYGGGLRGEGSSEITAEPEGSVGESPGVLRNGGSGKPGLAVAANGVGLGVMSMEEIAAVPLKTDIAKRLEGEDLRAEAGAP